MTAELPSITSQRRKEFRPNSAEITYAYNLINRVVFRNQLRKPFIKTGRVNHAWGMCNWHDQEQYNGTFCELWVADKWFCPQWFLNTLAHEMVHQWQWDVYRFDYLAEYGRGMNEDGGGHGPSFYQWRDEFKYYGLHLKGWYRTKKWFKYQNFSKC
jgi:hypothetical protein